MSIFVEFPYLNLINNRRFDLIIQLNLSNEELKKDLAGIDDQIQRHVLQESQLTSHKAQIQSVIASSNDLLKRNHPQSRLIHEKVQDMVKLFEVCCV